MVFILTGRLETASIRVARNKAQKKADVAEHPKVFHHVGLLVNEPPAGPGCSLYSHPKTSRQTLICRPRKSHAGCNSSFFYYNYMTLSTEHNAIRHSAGLWLGVELSCAKHRFPMFCRVVWQTASGEIKIGILDHVRVRMKTQGEIEAAVCEGIARFEQDYMGRGPKDIHAYLIGDLLVVRLKGVLTVAEQQFVASLTADKGTRSAQASANPSRRNSAARHGGDDSRDHRRRK